MPGLSEKQLRTFETRVLGPKHAAEHARERRLVRHRAARLRHRRAKLRRMPAPARKRLLRDEARQRRLAKRGELAYVRSAATGPPASIGQWDPAGPFSIPVIGINAAILPTGKVFWYAYPVNINPTLGSPTAPNTALAYVWDPSKGTGPSAFKRVDPPNFLDPISGQMKPANIWCGATSALPNGAILATGGTLDTRPDWKGLNKVYTFDPFSETWTTQPDMRHGRWYPTNVELADGRTVILGGLDETGLGFANHRNLDIEIFTPSSDPRGVGTMSLLGTRTLSSSGDATHAPNGSYFAHTFLMPSGNVLMAGPFAEDTWILRNPGPSNTYAWTNFANTATDRVWSNALIMPSATPGSTKVLQIGGSQSSGGTNLSVRTSETIDENNLGAGWQSSASWNIGRGHANTVLLPDGSMVTVGGGVGVRNDNQWSADENQKQVELWNPSTNTWSLGPPQVESRAYHSTAILLPDGRVVSAGDDWNGAGGPGAGIDNDTAEIYSPPYLFKGARPTVTAAPTGVNYAAQFNVDTPDTNVTKAVLMGLNTTTHAVDMNQRYVPLALSQRTGGVTLTSPANGNLAPPGYYMLFLVNSNGVPSIARFVQLGGPGTTPPPTDTTPPAKPATPTATAGNGAATINLSPKNTESDLASYVLQRKKTSDGAGFWAAVQTGLGNGSWPVNDTGLTNDTSYDYRVIAVDTTGNSSTPSDPVSVTPTGPPPPPPPPPGAGYAATVAGTAGVQGYWRFGDASGTTAAAAVGTRTGTYGAGTTLGQAGLITGDTNKAVSFSGNAKVTFGDAFDFNGTAFAFSLEAWVKPTTTDATSRRIFSKEWSDSTGGQGYYLVNRSSNLQFARLRNDLYEVVNGPSIPVGQTKHVVITYNGATMRMYLNGAEVANSPSINAMVDSTAAFTIGAKASGGGNWAGTIDEPAVYNTVLSPATIAAHYQAGITGTPPPTDTTPPAKPATPTATPLDAAVRLSLSPLNTESDLASYTIQRKLTSQAATSFAAVKTGVLTWPQTDTTVTNGTSYDYRVIAVDSTGNPSTPSDPVTVTPVKPPDTTPPAKPAAPSVTALDAAARIGLSPLNTEPDLASYRLQRKLTSQAATSFADVQSGITSVAADRRRAHQRDLLRLPGDRRRHDGQPLDAVRRGERHPDGRAAAARHDAARQAGHARRRPPATARRSINLSPLNGETDLASYTLQRKLSTQGTGSWASVQTGITSWPQTSGGLTNGTSYDFRVIALDTTGNASTPSDPVSVTPVAPPAAGYASTVTGTAGLQGYWRFGDASGTTAAAAFGLVDRHLRRRHDARPDRTAHRRRQQGGHLRRQRQDDLRRRLRLRRPTARSPSRPGSSRRPSTARRGASSARRRGRTATT